MTAYAGRLVQIFRHREGSVAVVPPDVNYEPQEGDQLIHEVCDVTLRFPIDGKITAYLEVMPRVKGITYNAEPRWLVRCPGDGKVREIARVEFADGSTWEK